MKKILVLLLSAGMMLSLVACTSTEETTTETTEPEEVTVADGTYTAPVNGFYGPFEVSVTFADGKVTNVVASENMETPTLGGLAIEKINAAVVENQTCNVDVVTGATVTSMVYRNAIKAAFTEAGAPETMFATVEVEPTEVTMDADLVVVGAGAGGYGAAVTAAELGAKVILIEKQDLVGGSCITSAGIVYAALDEADIPGMEKYYMDRAEGKGDADIINTYCENTMDTMEWLTNNGVEWMFSAPSGTAPEPRANFAMGITGASLICPLEAAADKLGVTTITDCAGYELVVEDGAVVGVLAKGRNTTYTFNAKAVVLATGGFDADEADKAEWSPIAVGDFPLSSKGNTGDGIEMGMAIGAATEFKAGIIGFMFCNAGLPASGNSNAVLTAPAYIDGTGAYAFPGIDYPINYTALKAHGGDTFYALWDANGEGSAQSAVDQGHGFRGETVEDLAGQLGVDSETLQASFDTAGLDTTAGPLFAIEAKPTTIGSMGGLVINTSAEVLDEAGNPIPGLYAAGEVCNPGLYYIEYPASGTSNSASFTYGRIAAKSAVAYIGE